MSDYIRITTLVQAIKNATETMEVCVPGKGFDARTDQWETGEITYVDPVALIAILKMFE